MQGLDDGVGKWGSGNRATDGLLHIDSEEWFRAVCGAVKSARGRRGHRGHSGMPIQLRKSRRES